ncbi:MAG: UDP-N-acetylglucosamine 2-epimerase (non-hydrolyzing) [Ignavibacteriales bacterium CG_4_9_14_3_um_filter_34_10]|nr:MAG: UDP-N-acetylglucosamine 2-epimerase (non-hydrolyzing) [Ignavibacteriales bacterium CG_4_9_14_3_um_filter_34_10]
MKKVISVVGARPNFMKVAPLYREFQKYKNIEHEICHTGQHYDEKMSKIFFEELELPKPDFYLGIGGGSHAEQTGKIMIEFEKVLLAERPDLVIVVGDVNSTIACTLTASKLHIKTAHVEAGLRSFDREMPEEVNRVLTDSISDLLFVTEKSGLVNLANEGIPADKIFFVGNVMIDSLNNFIKKSESSSLCENLGLTKNKFVLVTLHRPSNVDDALQTEKLIKLLNRIGDERKVVFPVHPRTKKNWGDFGVIETLSKNIILTEPIGYLDFINLIKYSELIITDSGGIQEESTFLGVQCITLRNSTERPVTVDVGTNQLLGNDLEKAEKTALEVLNGKIKHGAIPELWDGKASQRIVSIMNKYLAN